jgi:hypothetical protein
MINNIYSDPTVGTSYYDKNTSANFKTPDVPNMITKGQSDLNDSEFEKRIMEMARRDVAAGQNSKFTPNGKTDGTDEWYKLYKDYISAASPDRKGIITNTLTNFANRMGSIQLKFNSGNFFQVLFRNNGLFGADVNANFIDFRDSGGNKIARYSQTAGWVNFLTPSEDARGKDFLAKWDNAIAQASREIKNPNPVTIMDIKA